MLPLYTITAIKLGTLRVNKASMMYMTDFDRWLDLPVWAAAVEGAGHKILIDTGIANHDRWNREVDPCWREEDETIDNALVEIGWTIRDVDLVINSHLHFDHAENNTRFRDAEFVVSRAEWEYAQHPLPCQQALYDFEWTDESVSYLNYRLVATDDFDLLPGLRLIQTPGHSKGHQSVLIHTAEGVVCVAGDAACLPESFTGPVPPGGATSIEEGYRSLERIRQSADRVFMNHDPNIRKYQTEDFLVVPAVGAQLPADSIESLPPRADALALS